MSELLRALVVYASPEGFAAPLAQSISAGCGKAGAQAELLDLKETKGLQNYPWFGNMRKPEKIPVELSPFGVVFVGFETGSLSESRKAFDFIDSNDWSGRKVALFCSFESRKKALEEAAATLERRGARVVNTLGLHRHGLVTQKLAETDLARAEAFGERTCNNVLERRVFKENEKSRIRGYVKE